MRCNTKPKTKILNPLNTFLAVISFSVLYLSSPALSKQETQGPMLTCAEPVHDFGKALNSEVITHDFIIRNEGSNDLFIEKIKSSCGCTTASLPTNYLAAGKELAISAKASLKTQKGPLEKTIDVFSNDPLQPVYTLAIRGHVVSPYSLSPPTALMEISPNNPNEQGNVRLTFEADRPITVTGTSTQHLGYASASLETVVTGKEYLITFTLDEKATEKSQIGGALYVMTDSPDAEKISVPYSARRIRDVVVAPTKITIPTNLSSGQFNQRLILRHRRAMNTDITAITVPTKNVVATSSRKSKSLHFVKVRFDQIRETVDGTSLVIHVAYENGKEDVLYVPIEFSEQ